MHRPGALTALASVAALAGASAVTFSGALRLFFAQDDWSALARARDLLPRLAGPIRYLSHQLYFDAMRPVGLDPTAYHVVSLVLHAACAGLLYLLLRRWMRAAAALFGAAFFAVHPAGFHAQYWVIAAGDSMALFFALLAVLAGVRDGPVRWLALPAFALSLLAKESTLLLPLALAAMRAFEWRGRDPRARGPDPYRIGSPTIAMGVMSVAWVALLSLQRSAGAEAGGVYPLSAGHHLATNALTYLGWTAQCVRPALRGFTDSVDPRAYPFGLAVLALWLAGTAVRALRARGWIEGGVVYLALLLPVLPLRDHTYHYYLTAALIGAGWCVGALCDALLPKRLGEFPAWAASAGLLLLLTLEAHATVRAIERHPFVLPGLYADPIVDRAHIAARVRDALAATDLPAGVELRFWSPQSVALAAAGRPGGAARESYWEKNVRLALADGLAVRLMFPNVRAVRFVRAFSPVAGNLRYAVYRPDGGLKVGTSEELEAVIAASGASAER